MNTSRLRLSAGQLLLNLAAFFNIWLDQRVSLSQSSSRQVKPSFKQTMKYIGSDTQSNYEVFVTCKNQFAILQAGTLSAPPPGD